MLLKDSRVAANEPDKDGHTPIWWAAKEGKIEVIRTWIASEREIYLGEPGNEKNDAITIAKTPEIASLLKDYRDKRHKVGERPLDVGE